jgi:hypothetical protein
MWRKVKGQVASRNITCDMEDVKRLCEEIFHSVDEKDWKPLCEHVKKFENGYYDRDARFDVTIEPIIIIMGRVESDSSEEDSSTDTEDDEMRGIALPTGSNG